MTDEITTWKYNGGVARYTGINRATPGDTLRSDTQLMDKHGKLLGTHEFKYIRLDRQGKITGTIAKRGGGTVNIEPRTPGHVHYVTSPLHKLLKLHSSIEVWFSAQKTWYPGVIDKINEKKKKWHVSYDDGDERWEDFKFTHPADVRLRYESHKRKLHDPATVLGATTTGKKAKTTGKKATKKGKSAARASAVSQPMFLNYQVVSRLSALIALPHTEGSRAKENHGQEGNKKGQKGCTCVRGKSTHIFKLLSSQPDVSPHCSPSHRALPRQKAR